MVQAEAGLGWKLSGEGRQQGVFDAVVIAHNGKCANRLVGPTGAPKVASQLMGLRLSAIWAVMVAFEGDVGAPFEGAFVQGSDVLTWAGVWKSEWDSKWCLSCCVLDPALDPVSCLALDLM